MLFGTWSGVINHYIKKKEEIDRHCLPILRHLIIQNDIHSTFSLKNSQTRICGWEDNGKEPRFVQNFIMLQLLKHLKNKCINKKILP